jgi:hypothetical protein
VPVQLATNDDIRAECRSDPLGLLPGCSAAGFDADSGALQTGSECRQQCRRTPDNVGDDDYQPFAAMRRHRDLALALDSSRCRQPEAYKGEVGCCETSGSADLRNRPLRRTIYLRGLRCAVRPARGPRTWPVGQRARMFARRNGPVAATCILR